MTEQITGQIQGFAFGGDGILKQNGKVVFVPFAAPGDHLTCRITHSKKNYAFGEIVQIESSSPDRITPRCPYFGTCGGCQLQHVDEATQLAYKQQAVIDALQRIGGFTALPPIQAVPAQENWAYRRHITLQLKPLGDEFVAGYIATDNSSLLPVTQCPIFCSPKDPVIAELHAFLKHLKATPSNSGKATLIKESPGKYLLVLHLKHPPSQLEESLHRALQDAPCFVGVIASTPRGIITLGQTEIQIEVQGLHFQISPLAFLQNHPEQSLRIYQEIEKKIEKGPVLDLYCGIGITSLLLARKGFPVIGVEFNREAVRIAQQNACKYDLLKAQFIQADVADVVDRLLKEKRPSWVVINPPREGLDKRVTNALQSHTPQKILYLSCMPSTLARDLKDLSRAGYQITACQPFDMFPQTGHVETLVELS